jgi:hypothetical protein
LVVQFSFGKEQGVAEAKELTGGCLCGAVRYRIEGTPGQVTHCHCTICRKSSGAAFVTWVGFPVDAFAFVKGTPAIHRATAKAERAFCPACGTQLTFRHADSAQQIDVTAGSLDDPEAVRPDAHIWIASRLPWLALADGLPRYQGERED